MTLYKVLDDLKPNNGGVGKWHPWQWMPPVDGEITPCKNGYHLCRREDLIEWLGPDIWEAEGIGDMVECANKVVFREARLITRFATWNDRTQRLFAADCAERVLHVFERKHPNNDLPRKAIQAARDFAHGLITRDELAAAQAAARVAGAAAQALAARYAAGAAERAARDDAEGAAAWAFARVAAGTVAEVAARVSARAARVAQAAAWAFARVSARAARDDAASAEMAWQTDRLFQYLDGEV